MTTRTAELYEVTIYHLPSRAHGNALSTSQQQNQDHPRSGIIFIRSMNVNVCFWCSRHTTEIINQKQLQCTWQIAALPSLQGTCFIYTSSLVSCWLITFQVQYLKVRCWHGLHLSFPQGSHTPGPGRKFPCVFSDAAISLTISTSGQIPVPPPQGQLLSPPLLNVTSESVKHHELDTSSPQLSRLQFQTTVSQLTFRTLNSLKPFKAGRGKWRSH